MRTALVTGAGGFIGQHLCRTLVAGQWRVLALTRAPAMLPAGVEAVSVQLDLDSSNRLWVDALTGVDCVYHLAGVAHRRGGADELAQINVEAPVRLFQASMTAGVGRFVWLSSIKVLGDVSARPLKESDPYAPADAYGQSKVDGERRLLDLAGVSRGDAPAGHTGLVILRPPLVYGAGVKANFRSLLRLADLARRGVPLPLGGAQAPRSLVGVKNLCDCLLRCAAVGTGVLHVADARDFSVAELVRILAPDARLWKVTPGVMGALLGALGRSAIQQRLFEPLQVDQAASNLALGWQPPHPSEELLQETMTWYLQQ